MLADKQQVLNLIPQKPPMTMVDGLLEFDSKKTVSSLTVNAGNLFVEDGFFKEPGLIEHIAQSAALQSGYAASQSGEKPRIGFIGSIKRMKIFFLPKVGDTLITKVTVLMNMKNISVIIGEVTVSGKLAAEGEMNIFLQ